MLAICLAIAKGLIGGTSDSGMTVMLHVGKELGGSLAAGALLGLLLIGYIRFIKAEMLLFVAAMILVVGEVAKALHLELLLVFIAAGFVVRNFSKYEHDLLHAVEMVALPVFVVFFTIAGASIDLAASWTVLPLALAVCVARAVAYFVAGRVGAVVGNEPESVRTHAWTAYLPQAGVTLGLVGLAATSLESMRTQIMSAGMAMVAVNLLIGPITLRRALGAAGEIPTDVAEQSADSVGEAAERPSRDDEETERRREEAAASLSDEVLTKHMNVILGRLEGHTRKFLKRELSAWAESTTTAAEEALTRPGVGLVLEEYDADAKGRALRQLFQNLRDSLRRAPEFVEVALGDHNRFAEPDDSRWVQLKKRMLRVSQFLRLRGDKRSVPVEAAARLAWEGRIADVLAAQLGIWMRAEFAIHDQIVESTLNQETTDQAMERVRTLAGRVSEYFDSDIQTTFTAGYEEMARTLRIAGGPSLRASRLRASKLDSGVRAALASLEKDPADWQEVSELLNSEFEMARMTRELRASYESTLQRSVLDPAEKALGGVEAVLGGVERRLREIRDQAESAELTAEQRSSLATLAREAFDADEQAALEASAARFRASASMHTVALELRGHIDGLPEAITLPRGDVAPRSAASPDDIKPRVVSVRSRARAAVLEQLLAGADRSLRIVASTVIDTAAKLRQARGTAVDVLQAPATDAPVATLTELDRALDQLTAQRELLGKEILAVVAELDQLASDAFGKIMRARSGGDVPTGDSEGVRARVRELISPVTDRIGLLRNRMSEFYRRATGSQFGKQVKARYQSEGFDAASIRDYVTRWTNEPPLPPDYRQVFTTAPVNEQRLFTAHRDVLEAVLASESEWLAGTGAAGLLIIGEHGSGRTSLLNLLELELRAGRVLRPEPLGGRREIGVQAAVAIELSTRSSARAIQSALLKKPSSILVDDFEQWFSPEPAGIKRLERFLELVARSKANWVVCVEKHALSILEDCVPIRQVFGRVLTLQPLSVAETEEAVMARHRLTGRELEFPSSVVTRVLARIQRTSAEQLYFRLLAKAAGGNIGRSIAQWRHQLDVDQRGALLARPDLSFALGLPFLGRLEPLELATLLQLLRFGPLSERELATSLGAARSQVTRQVHFLSSAGLVQKHSDGVEIPQSLRPAVGSALSQLGVRE